MLEENHTYIVAEIGINHNGRLDRAKNLILAAKKCGADAVKFQKRTVDVVYTADELARIRPNPFGKTNGDLKRGLEFGFEEYKAIDDYCRELQIPWYASPWDSGSVRFLNEFGIPFLKIASACLTDTELLKDCAASRPLMISTGMSTAKQITNAVSLAAAQGAQIACIYACTSTYPTPPEEINIARVTTLQKLWLGKYAIGYSGHEMSIAPSVAAVALGARSIERHITLSRADWGSDQAASLDVEGFRRLCRDIRLIEKATGDGDLGVYHSELPIIDKLRRVNTL